MILQNDPVFCQLPASEQEYLAKNAVRIVQQASSDSLEGVLKGVVDFRKDLDYGWEEAVLQGKFYRWPSEINQRIFCSEKALTSYLLLRALGVRAEYGIVENSNSNGMSHEVVFVPKKDG